MGHFESSVQSLSCVWLFVTTWTAARQASLSITNSQSLLNLNLMSIELVMPSNHLILCHPLLILPSIFPSIGVLLFLMSQFLASGGQSIGASASVLPMNIQDWFPLGSTGLISLLFKGLSQESSPASQFKSISFSTSTIWRVSVSKDEHPWGGLAGTRALVCLKIVPGIGDEVTYWGHYSTAQRGLPQTCIALLLWISLPLIFLFKYLLIRITIKW